MKEGLIRLTDETDIFYDSVEKVYRYRMHCPNCGKQSEKCQCYDDLDRLLNDIDDGIANYTCSAKCALLVDDWDNLNEAMQAVGNKDADELIETLTDVQIGNYLRDYLKLFGCILDPKSIPIEQLITIVRENNLEDDILEEYKVSRGKTVKELTEEEATTVLNVLIEDEFDGDYPSGDECKV